MIKDLRAYWLDPSCVPDFDTMATLASGYPARECKYLERSTIGFREFPTLNNQQVIEVCGSRFLYAEALKFKRSVPSSVMKRELEKRVKKLIEAGQEVSRADKQSIKSDIESELLPKMPQLETVIPVVFDTQRNLLWIGAGSEGTAKEPQQLMTNGGLSLSAMPLFSGIDVGRWLTDWSLGQQELPEGTDLGERAKVSALSVPKIGISITNEDLLEPEIQALIKERSVMDLSLVSEGISYNLTHEGALKGIKVEGPDDSYDDLIHQASATILEIANTLDTLIERVGAKTPFN